MTAPRPGDAYWLDVIYRDGETARSRIEAHTLHEACAEAAWTLGVHGPYAAPERRNPVGRLHRTVDGQFVTEGDERHFEGMS